MKISCHTISDLLPLYQEKLTHPKTNQLVEHHLAECDRCRTELAGLEQPLAPPQPDDPAPLKTVKASLKTNRRRQIGLAVCLIALVGLAAFSRLSLPRYLPYSDDLVKLERSSDGTLSAAFSPQATSVETFRLHDPDNNTPQITIVAWTSHWDKLIKRGAEPKTITLRTPQQPDVAIQYADYTRTDSPNLIALPASSAASDSGSAILPRLALNLYSMAALISAGVSLLLWFSLRRSRFAPVIRSVFFASLSYLAGSFLITGCSGASFHILRDLSFILLLTGFAFGVCHFGYQLWRSRRPV